MYHLCFAKPKNAGIQMAVSKVREPHTSPGVIPRSSVSLIQIVLIDNKTGSQVGVHAEQLAKDIMNDIAEHGNFVLSLLLLPQIFFHSLSSSAKPPELQQCILPRRA